MIIVKGLLKDEEDDDNNTCSCCSYFQEAWALAIFHDRFPDFRDEVRELLISRPVSAGQVQGRCRASAGRCRAGAGQVQVRCRAGAGR